MSLCDFISCKKTKDRKKKRKRKGAVENYNETRKGTRTRFPRHIPRMENHDTDA